jgi:hypothetical protein
MRKRYLLLLILSFLLGLHRPCVLAQQMPAQVVARALSAPGARWTSGQIADRVSEGRLVDGLLTPFKIERFLDNLKAEEIQLESVIYNAAVNDDIFKP